MNEICKEWLDDSTTILWAQVAISVVTLIINLILEEIVQHLSKKMKHSTHTENITYLTRVTFVVTFVNTAFISLLDTYSFVEIDGGKGWLSKVFPPNEGD
jgi:hypothetical protein